MRTFDHTGEGRPISAETVQEAAEKLARRMYGPRGTVGALRHDSDTVSGSGRVTGSTWEAFIGRGPTAADRRRGDAGVTGANVTLWV